MLASLVMLAEMNDYTILYHYLKTSRSNQHYSPPGNLDSPKDQRTPFGWPIGMDGKYGAFDAEGRHQKESRGFGSCSL